MRAAAALLVGFAAFQVVLIGLVMNTYTASPGSASPRRELQEPSAGEEVAPAAERDELRERLARLEATVQQQREGIMTEVKQGVLAAVRNEIDQLKEDFAAENSQLASRGSAGKGRWCTSRCASRSIFLGPIVLSGSYTHMQITMHP